MFIIIYCMERDVPYSSMYIQGHKLTIVEVQYVTFDIFQQQKICSLPISIPEKFFELLLFHVIYLPSQYFCRPLSCQLHITVHNRTFTQISIKQVSLISWNREIIHFDDLLRDGLEIGFRYVIQYAMCE